MTLTISGLYTQGEGDEQMGYEKGEMVRGSEQARGEKEVGSDSSEESGACGSERILPDSPIVLDLRSFNVFLCIV